jgi:lauroyl/myristoyl acyltransferase
MRETRRWWQGLAVQGVLWRKYVDWAILNAPFYFHPLLICFATFLFFFIAAPARKMVLRHLQIVLPGSWGLVNYFRALRIFYNYAWTLADAAAYKLLKSPFTYKLDGENFLEQLAAAKGAIVLTAHMGNYDLGAALFAEKFQRQIRMVRAPEADALSAQHVDLSLQQSSAGAVKVDYSNEGTALAFDLLHALRNGEIISIQGDRVVGEVARSAVDLFGVRMFVPTGPFVLSLVAGVPIHPLFIVRSGYRKYRITAREPIVCSGNQASRDDQIAGAMRQWAKVLEVNIRRRWQQWYAFTPVFDT